MRLFRPNPEYPTKESRFALQWAMVMTLCFGVFMLSVVQEQIIFSKAVKDVQERIVGASKKLRVDTGDCIGWKATEYCVPYGPRNKWKDRGCSHVIGKNSAGWCQCSNGIRVEISCSFPHTVTGTCTDRCAAHIGMLGENFTREINVASKIPPEAVRRSDLAYKKPISPPRVTFVMLFPTRQTFKPAYETLQRFESNVNYLVSHPYTFFHPYDWAGYVKNAFTRIVTTPATFTTIPPEHWVIESWVDRERLNGRGKIFSKKKVLSDPPEVALLAQVNRWWAGYVFKEKALKEFEYYWRVDVDAFYYCPILHSPVAEMIAGKKDFGYMVPSMEQTSVFPQLSRMVREYLVKTSQSLAFEPGVFSQNVLSSCAPSTGSEIVKISAVNTVHYNHLFEHLESTGGFFYEKWPDNLVRFVGLSLTSPSSAFAYFDTIAYADQKGWNVPFDPAICSKDHMLPFKAAMGRPKLQCLMTLKAISNETFVFAQKM